ncbi:hypothetical protein M885DRAFT_516574 [Pelagophyceae sp. CCMP2097]|nr:hypothetical protein M885DRAFT_516574 [Pelagophyceae sp. CCMP2097]
MVLDAGGVQLALDAVLRHEDDAGVLSSALALLAALVRDSPEQQTIVASQGAIELTLKAMRKFDGDEAVQRAGCGLLAAIIAGNSTYQKVVADATAAASKSIRDPLRTVERTVATHLSSAPVVQPALVALMAFDVAALVRARAENARGLRAPLAKRRADGMALYVSLLETVLAAVEAHPAHASIQDLGGALLLSVADVGFKEFEFSLDLANVAALLKTVRRRAREDELIAVRLKARLFDRPGLALALDSTESTPVDDFRDEGPGVSAGCQAWACCCIRLEALGKEGAPGQNWPALLLQVLDYLEAHPTHELVQTQGLAAISEIIKGSRLERAAADAPEAGPGKCVIGEILADVPAQRRLLARTLHALRTATHPADDDAAGAHGQAAFVLEALVSTTSVVDADALVMQDAEAPGLAADAETPLAAAPRSAQLRALRCAVAVIVDEPSATDGYAQECLDEALQLFARLLHASTAGALSIASTAADGGLEAWFAAPKRVAWVVELVEAGMSRWIQLHAVQCAGCDAIAALVAFLPPEDALGNLALVAVLRSLVLAAPPETTAAAEADAAVAPGAARSLEPTAAAVSDVAAAAAESDAAVALQARESAATAEADAVARDRESAAAAAVDAAALGALRRLVAGSTVHRDKLVCATDGTTRLFNAMRLHPTNALVQERACGLVAAIAGGNYKRVDLEDADDAGSLRVLPSGEAAAALAVESAAEASFAKCRRILAAQGAVGLVVSALRCFPDDAVVLTTACAAAAALSCAAPQLQKSFVADGAYALLLPPEADVKRLGHGEALLATAGAAEAYVGAIRHLAVPALLAGDRDAAMIAGGGGVDETLMCAVGRIIDVFKLHGDDAAVRAQAFDVLRACAVGRPALVAHVILRRPEAVEMLVRLRHADAETQRQAAAFFLAFADGGRSQAATRDETPDAVTPAEELASNVLALDSKLEAVFSPAAAEGLVARLWKEAADVEFALFGGSGEVALLRTMEEASNSFAVQSHGVALLEDFAIRGAAARKAIVLNRAAVERSVSASAAFIGSLSVARRVLRLWTLLLLPELPEWPEYPPVDSNDAADCIGWPSAPQYQKLLGKRGVVQAVLGCLGHAAAKTVSAAARAAEGAFDGDDGFEATALALKCLHWLVLFLPRNQDAAADACGIATNVVHAALDYVKFAADHQTGGAAAKQGAASVFDDDVSLASEAPEASQPQPQEEGATAARVSLATSAAQWGAAALRACALRHGGNVDLALGFDAPRDAAGAVGRLAPICDVSLMVPLSVSLRLDPEGFGLGLALYEGRAALRSVARRALASMLRFGRTKAILLQGCDILAACGLLADVVDADAIKELVRLTKMHAADPGGELLHAAAAALCAALRHLAPAKAAERISAAGGDDFERFDTTGAAGAAAATALDDARVAEYATLLYAALLGAALAGRGPGAPGTNAFAVDTAFARRAAAVASALSKHRADKHAQKACATALAQGVKLFTAVLTNDDRAARGGGVGASRLKKALQGTNFKAAVTAVAIANRWSGAPRPKPRSPDASTRKDTGDGFSGGLFSLRLFALPSAEAQDAMMPLLNAALKVLSGVTPAEAEALPAELAEAACTWLAGLSCYHAAAREKAGKAVVGAVRCLAHSSAAVSRAACFAVANSCVGHASNRDMALQNDALFLVPGAEVVDFEAAFAVMSALFCKAAGPGFSAPSAEVEAAFSASSALLQSGGPAPYVDFDKAFAVASALANKTVDGSATAHEAPVAEAPAPVAEAAESKREARGCVFEADSARIVGLVGSAHKLLADCAADAGDRRLARDHAVVVIGFLGVAAAAREEILKRETVALIAGVLRASLAEYVAATTTPPPEDGVSSDSAASDGAATSDGGSVESAEASAARAVARGCCEALTALLRDDARFEFECASVKHWDPGLLVSDGVRPLLDAEPAVCEYALYVVGACASTSGPASLLARRSGFVYFAVGKMQQHAGDAGLQAAACRCLGGLASRVAVPSDRDVFQQAPHRARRRSEAQVMINDASGVDAVAAALAAHLDDARVCAAGLFALGSLARGQKGVQSAIAADHMAPILAAPQRWPRDKLVLAQFCFCVAALAFEHPSNRKHLAALPAVAQLIHGGVAPRHRAAMVLARAVPDHGASTSLLPTSLKHRASRPNLQATSRQRASTGQLVSPRERPGFGTSKFSSLRERPSTGLSAPPTHRTGTAGFAKPTQRPSSTQLNSPRHRAVQARAAAKARAAAVLVEKEAEAPSRRGGEAHVSYLRTAARFAYGAVYWGAPPTFASRPKTVQDPMVW